MTTITIYHAIIGSILFCDVIVDPDTPPWIALPVSEHGITWECGDPVLVWDGAQWVKRVALDAGPFGDHCVMQPDGACLPIVADMPDMHVTFTGLSTVGHWVNLRGTRGRGLAR